MAKAYLGLGSNMGDTKKHLDTAVSALQSTPGIEVVAQSSHYETDPWGYEDQAVFLNMVVAVETTLSPLALLEACQAVEQNLHRVREIHWGPRTIDVDILTFAGYTSQSATLTVPHAQMTKRGFVLVPLCELAPDLMVGDKSVLDWLKHVDQSGIRKKTYAT